MVVDLIVGPVYAWSRGCREAIIMIYVTVAVETDQMSATGQSNDKTSSLDWHAFWPRFIHKTDQAISGLTLQSRKEIRNSQNLVRG